jgi:hypothetical protein
MRLLPQTIGIAALILAGCSSVEVISSADQVPEGKCKVTVYQTRAQAAKHGEIDELCIISGSSSGSFDHSVATAIAKHKDKACACGATNVFVESRSEASLDVAKVTMIAFRYVTNAAQPVQSVGR